MDSRQEISKEDREEDPACVRGEKRSALFLLRHNTVNFLLFVCFSKGIAPITVVTHRGTLRSSEDCENALDEASAATGSSISNTFFVSNYNEDNKERNPEIEKIVFDILDCALMTAERAVKMMKLKEKNKQEGDICVCVISLNNYRKQRLSNPISYFMP